MEISQFLVIGCAVLAGLVVVMMIGLFFVSRKSQKVMQSLLDIMLQPERIKITEATRVLGVLLADEIGKIEQSFQKMRDTCNAQINYANELKESLTTQNEHLVGLADDATARVDGMAQRLDDTVAKLGDIVQCESWKNTKSTTETFSSTVFTFILSFSHNSMSVAPLEAASIAIVPEPLNKSSQDFPVKSPIIAKTDSLILSMAGLITPSGHFIILPFNFPPVILICYLPVFKDQ